MAQPEDRARILVGDDERGDPGSCDCRQNSCDPVQAGSAATRAPVEPHPEVGARLVKGCCSDPLAVAPRSGRREPRQDTIRIVEYTRFPRIGRERAPRIGFTRDLSASGMCIGADEPEPVGSLLRVTLRGVDGRPARACVERVVWCSPTRDGRHWIGAQRLAEAETV